MPAFADERRILAGDAGGRVHALSLEEPGVGGAATKLVVLTATIATPFVPAHAATGSRRRTP